MVTTTHLQFTLYVPFCACLGTVWAVNSFCNLSNGKVVRGRVIKVHGGSVRTAPFILTVGVTRKWQKHLHATAVLTTDQNICNNWMAVWVAVRYREDKRFFPLLTIEKWSLGRPPCNPMAAAAGREFEFYWLHKTFEHFDKMHSAVHSCSSKRCHWQVLFVCRN